MHHFIKIISIPLILLLICSCSKNSVKIKMNTKTYSGDGYSVTMEIPEIQDDSEYATQFNSDYIALGDTLFNNFTAQAEKSETTRDTLNISQEIKFNKNRIISIVANCEAYTGGTHKSQSRISKNTDLNTGKEIGLTELFNDGAYTDRINSYISTLLETNPEKFNELWKIPTISENQDFYITNDGIVICYPPYELSYYSKGFVEIEVPYEEIESYLNPGYAERIWN